MREGMMRGSGGYRTNSSNGSSISVDDNTYSGSNGRNGRHGRQGDGGSGRGSGGLNGLDLSAYMDDESLWDDWSRVSRRQYRRHNTHDDNSSLGGGASPGSSFGSNPEYEEMVLNHALTHNPVLQKGYGVDDAMFMLAPSRHDMNKGGSGNGSGSGTTLFGPGGYDNFGGVSSGKAIFRNGEWVSDEADPTIDELEQIEDFDSSSSSSSSTNKNNNNKKYNDGTDTKTLCLKGIQGGKGEGVETSLKVLKITDVHKDREAVDDVNALLAMDEKEENLVSKTQKKALIKGPKRDDSEAVLKQIAMRSNRRAASDDGLGGSGGGRQGGEGDDKGEYPDDLDDLDNMSDDDDDGDDNTNTSRDDKGQNDDGVDTKGQQSHHQQKQQKSDNFLNVIQSQLQKDQGNGGKKGPMLISSGDIGVIKYLEEEKMRHQQGQDPSNEYDENALDDLDDDDDDADTSKKQITSKPNNTLPVPKPLVTRASSDPSQEPQSSHGRRHSLTLLAGDITFDEDDAAVLDLEDGDADVTITLSQQGSQASQGKSVQGSGTQGNSSAVNGRQTKRASLGLDDVGQSAIGIGHAGSGESFHANRGPYTSGTSSASTTPLFRADDNGTSSANTSINQNNAGSGGHSQLELHERVLPDSLVQAFERTESDHLDLFGPITFPIAFPSESDTSHGNGDGREKKTPSLPIPKSSSASSSGSSTTTYPVFVSFTRLHRSDLKYEWASQMAKLYEAKLSSDAIANSNTSTTTNTSSISNNDTSSNSTSK